MGQAEALDRLQRNINTSLDELRVIMAYSDEASWELYDALNLAQATVGDVVKRLAQ